MSIACHDYPPKPFCESFQCCIGQTSILGTIKRLLDDPETSQSWGNAIRKQLPVVIAEEEQHLENFYLGNRSRT